MRHYVERDFPELEIEIASCGLGTWHLGQLPDERMRNAVKNRGIYLVSKAQMIAPHFFDRYDYILVADHKILNEIYRYPLTLEQKAKIHLMSRFSDVYKDQEIPDPYYGGDDSFEEVLDMLEDCCLGLVKHLHKHHSKKNKGTHNK